MTSLDKIEISIILVFVKSKLPIKVSYQSLRTILFSSLYYKTTILCACSFAPFIHNQMGEARPLNLLNTAVWLISICSHPCPFCLRLGDSALAPCVCTCEGKNRNQQTSNGKKEMHKAYERGIK